MEKRVEWIDALRGVAILLVVLSHSYTLKPPIPLNEPLFYLLKFVLLINLVSFLFVSGFLYKVQTNQKEYIINKALTLLIPFFSFLLLFLPANILVGSDQNIFFVTDSVFLDLIRYFSGRSISNMITGPLWFLPTLFFTLVVYNFVQNKCKPWLVNIIVILMYIISFVIFYKKQNLWLPLYFHLIFVATPFLHIGYLIKVYKVKVNKVLLLLGFILTIFSSLYFLNNLINFNDNFYGVPVITILGSVICFLILKETLIFFERKTPFITTFLAKLGKASMIIMAFHSAIILLLHKIITNSFLMILITVLLSYFIYLFIDKYTFTRALFIGNKVDLRLIYHKIIKK